jgi:hypothetical protein
MIYEATFRVSDKLHARPICNLVILNNRYEKIYPGIAFNLKILSGRFSDIFFDNLRSFSDLDSCRNQYNGESVKLTASGDYSKEILTDCVKNLSNLLINSSCETF